MLPISRFSASDFFRFLHFNTHSNACLQAHIFCLVLKDASYIFGMEKSKVEGINETRVGHGHTVYYTIDETSGESMHDKSKMHHF